MKIPNSEEELRVFLRWLIDCCTNSQNERRPLYEKRRRYALYGQNRAEMVRVNELDSTNQLLKSFLFAPDQVSWSVSAAPNADEAAQAKFLAVQDDWNESASASGLCDAYNEALGWALNYDTMILKLGWNDRIKQEFAEIVEPSVFGVFEEYRDFNSQQAYTHSFVLDYDDAVGRLFRAGLAHRIPDLKVTGGGTSDTGLPPMVSQLIVSATGGGNAQGVSGNVMGTVASDYEASPTYTAKVPHSVVAFHEATVYDDDAQDWRMFHVIDPDIILSDSRKTIDALTKAGSSKVKAQYASPTNLFLKSEHPFIAITPYQLYNYVWGEAFSEKMIPLQNWLMERLTQIDEILEAQVDPAKAFTGYGGLDDERMEAFGGPGTYVQDAMPGSKVDAMRPPMPEDLFAEFDRILTLFMERAGLTEILMGRGEKNVRSRSHARQLQTTGGGRVRQVATGLEKSLTRLADVGLRLKAKNDDTVLRTPATPENPKGEEFVLAQVLDGDDYSVKVSGHDHSPLFTMESSEIAFALYKAKAITRQWLIRLLRPAHMNDLLHEMRKVEQAEAAQKQAEMAAGVQPGARKVTKPNGHAEA